MAKKLIPNVKPRKGGGVKYSLYCYTCGEWVENIASEHLQAQGVYKYEHECKKSK